MIRFVPPFKTRYIASVSGGVTGNIASIGVAIGVTCAATVVHDVSASASVSVSAQAKGHFTYFAIADVTISATAAGQRTAGGTANIGVNITTSADATTLTAHSGTADVSVAINTTASATTITPIEGAATCAVTITASAIGTASQTHAGVASCQVNLSASAAANVANYLYESDVLSISNNLLWLRADDIDGDEDKTDNPSDNTSISSWASRNNGLTVSCTSGLEPTFQTNENGTLPAVKFDSTDELYVDWDSSMTNFTVFLVVKHYDSAASGGYIMDGGQASSSRLGWLDRATGNFRMGGVANFTEVLSESGQSADTDWHIITAHYNGANSSLRVDLSAADSGDIGASNGTYAASEGIVIGGANHTNLYGSKILVAEVLAYSGGLSTSDRDKVEGYLNDKWSITTIHSGSATCSVNINASADGYSVAAFSNGYSLDFGSQGNYVQLTDDDSIFDFGTNAFTMTVWFKMDSFPHSHNRLITGHDGADTNSFVMYVDSNDGIGLYGAGNTYIDAGSANVSTGAWYNGTITRSGTTVTVYLNGQQVAQNTSVSGSYVVNSSYGTHLGRDPALASNLAQFGLLGNMSHVGVWNEALTSSEVSAIYNSGNPLDLLTDSGNYSSSSGLQGYWRLQEGSGTSTADATGNSDDATISGATWSTDVPEATTHSGTASCQVNLSASASGSVSTFNNYSISLDGSNDYLSVSDHDDFSFGNSTSDSAFSVSAWIKMDDATKFRIFSKQTNSSNIEYVFGVDGLDRLGVNLYDAATSKFRGVYSASIQSYEGSWIHVVMTYDGTGGSAAYNGMELYLNGSLLSTSNNSGGGYTAMHNTSTDVWIGGANFVPDYANGKIDEVAVFSAELTSTQVSNIYNNGTPTDLSSESNLVGYWRMEENTGTTVADSSGNGHTATLNNGPTFSADTP